MNFAFFFNKLDNFIFFFKKGVYKKKSACRIRNVAEISLVALTRKEPQMWGFSSAGRAPALHAGGQEFESPNLHHKKDNDICYCPFYFVVIN